MFGAVLHFAASLLFASPNLPPIPFTPSVQHNNNNPAITTSIRFLKSAADRPLFKWTIQQQQKIAKSNLPFMVLFWYRSSKRYTSEGIRRGLSRVQSSNSQFQICHQEPPELPSKIFATTTSVPITKSNLRLMTEDPSTPLPRDETGSYLHLKLKRFPSISALKMPYAIKSWKSIPHDAEVDICIATRSSCRQCHSKINKGELRMRLWLQCHKGCKISAYFHGDDCFWKYPETSKLDCLDELVGFNDLPLKQQEKVSELFLILKEEGHCIQSDGGTKKKRRLN